MLSVGADGYSKILAILGSCDLALVSEEKPDINGSKALYVWSFLLV